MSRGRRFDMEYRAHHRAPETPLGFTSSTTFPNTACSCQRNITLTSDPARFPFAPKTASIVSQSDSSGRPTTISLDKKTDLPIVLVLGLIGAGKTTFINHITNADLAVGRGMAACTITSTHVTANIDGVEVALVDTPGFNNPARSDADILTDITTWIKDHLGGQTMVTAALYLHSIETKRLHGSASRNFSLFRTLVGRESMPNVGLVSTHWDVVLKDDAIDREADLASTDWSIMLASGARKYRLYNDVNSAQRMMGDMLRSQPKFIQIQKEMAKEFGKKALSETEAGGMVYNELVDRIEKEKADLRALEQYLAKPPFAKGDVNDAIEKQVAEMRRRLQRLRTDRRNVETMASWGATFWELAKKHGLGTAAASKMADLQVAASQAAQHAMQHVRQEASSFGRPLGIGLAISAMAVG
ncbi:MAG: hypothetical protein Q9168_006189, partial [Polycauliona sp. 1 TL-2023]